MANRTQPKVIKPLFESPNKYFMDGKNKMFEITSSFQNTRPFNITVKEFGSEAKEMINGKLLYHVC